MKKLFASCAVVALMAAPALAQSTTDPTMPDTVPVEPQMEQTVDEPDMFEPQVEALPEELPPEPDMAEEAMTPTPDAEPMMEAEATENDEIFAEAEPTVTAEMAPAEGTLEASVDEAQLPEEYSTDDLNAMMLAQVNSVGNEISELDREADVWVSADGAPVDPSYAPEGQGDMEVTTEEETPVTENYEDMAPEESGMAMEPETDPMTDDEWTTNNPLSPDTPE